jgi:hypothetical protein
MVESLDRTMLHLGETKRGAVPVLPDLEDAIAASGRTGKR